MNNKKDILQYLIRHCFFASNHSRLASLLGQRGRMNIVRLMSGEAGDRAVENLWNDISGSMSVPEGLMPFLPEVWALSDIVKRSPDAFPIEVPPEKQARPQDIDDAAWERIVALYQQDALLYYMLQAIVFAKRLKINPYRQKFMKGSEQVLWEIDARLHKAYPQQFNAHDAAGELIRTLEGIDVDSWWWIGIFGANILRLYHEPAYIATALTNYSFAMPFLDWQWWREEGSNNPTDTLWYWQKNGSSGALYEVWRVAYGQEAAKAAHFKIAFVGNNLLRLMKYEKDNVKSMYVEWEMERKEDVYTLRFHPDSENELSSLLPPALTMLDTRTDNADLVGRALDMTEAMQRETYCQIYREIGLEPTSEYSIEDIECSRRKVAVLYRRDGATEPQAATFALADYPSLSAVTPHSYVELFKGCSDNRLYAWWNDIGVLLPIQ